MECYLTVTCDSFSFLDIKKKNTNSAKRGFSYKRLTCEVSDLYSLLENHKLSKVLFAIIFPKIDKDLKTSF